MGRIHGPEVRCAWFACEFLDSLEIEHKTESENNSSWTILALPKAEARSAELKMAVAFLAWRFYVARWESGSSEAEAMLG